MELKETKVYRSVKEVKEDGEKREFFQNYPSLSRQYFSPVNNERRTFFQNFPR